MTDLQTAMREAVASAESGTTQGPRPARRPTGRGGVPRHRVMEGTYLEYLRAHHGSAVAAGIRVAGETLTLTVLFVLASMIVAFGEDAGTVTLPLLGTVSALIAAALATLALRGIIVALGRLDARLRTARD